MASLSLYLPPAAGDYSGAASVLFGLDCLAVLVDAGCCTRNYTEYDEPRWARRRKTTFSAQLRTLEATLGDESRLIEQTAEMARELGVSCIALLGTPVPAVTGMDLAGIACEVEAATGLPTLGVETSGFETYEQGASKALCALLGRFAQGGARGEAAGSRAATFGAVDAGIVGSSTCGVAAGAANPGASGARDEATHKPLHVNILGLGPQDFQCEEDMASCIGWFEQAGAVIDFVTSSEYTLADIARAGEADTSVVVAWSGLEAARLLEQRFGIPCIIGRPWCAEDARTLLEQARRAPATGRPPAPATAGSAALTLDAPDLAPGASAEAAPTRMAPLAPDAPQIQPPLPCLLLVGEQVAMNSLRTHIRKALAQAGQEAPSITVATRFCAESSLAELGDLSHIGEAELVAWGRAHPGFAWVGDPLFACLPGFSGNALATLPHEATSSTLHAAQARTLVGDAALKAVDSTIMERIGTAAQAASNQEHPASPGMTR